MNERCRDVQKKIDDMFAGRSSGDLEMIERHISDCPDCRRYQEGLLENDSLLTGFVRSVDEKLSHLEGKIMESIDNQTAENSTRREQSGGRGWTGIFYGRMMKFAAAAVVLAAIVIAVNFINRSGGDVVWAEVIRQVEEARDYICHIEQQNTSDPDLEMTHYHSAKYGMRTDMFRDGRLVAATYFKFSGNTMYTLIHRDKSYALVELSKEQIEEHMQSSAQNLVTHLREQSYEELGERTIEGVDATGIRVKNPESMRAAFDESEIIVWADDRTNWPVRIEWNAVAKGGDVRISQVLNKFQWNPVLSQTDFEFEIPDDYNMIGRMDAVKKDEPSAIEGLREYAKFSGGGYPTGLSYATAIHEAEDEIGRRRQANDLSKDDFGNLMKIQNACAFYAELVDADRDAAYYGDAVGPRDFDKVLMRWRLDDGRYRVIYGDLRAETVDADKLEELEGRD
jgi:outer membrane lipoprotein-sorting protein